MRQGRRSLKDVGQLEKPFKGQKQGKRDLRRFQYVATPTVEDMESFRFLGMGLPVKASLLRRVVQELLGNGCVSKLLLRFTPVDAMETKNLLLIFKILHVLIIQ